MKTISVEELYKRIQDKNDTNFILIDIREESERESMRIKEARSIPMPDIQKHLKELKMMQQEIIIHCASGGRSNWLAGRLEQNGIQVTNLLGGILGWIQKNYPIETGK